MSKQSSNGEAIYKAQAQRLRAFLSRAGVDLKNTHALEAIAHVHDAANWQALMNGLPASATDPQAAPGSDPPLEQQIFCIASRMPKYLHITLAKGRDLALRDFIQTARILSDLFSAIDVEIRVVGQDLDYGFPVLALTIDGLPLLQLIRPAVANDEEIVPDNKGGWKARKARPVSLCGLEDASSFVVIAAAMTAAFATRRNDESQPRHEQALNSHPALHFSLDAEEALPELALRSQRELDPPPVPCDPRALLLAMDKLKVMHTVIGMLRGGANE